MNLYLCDSKKPLPKIGGHLGLNSTRDLMEATTSSPFVASRAAPVERDKLFHTAHTSFLPSLLDIVLPSKEVLNFIQLIAKDPHAAQKQIEEIRTGTISPHPDIEKLLTLLDNQNTLTFFDEILRSVAVYTSRFNAEEFIFEVTMRESMCSDPFSTALQFFTEVSMTIYKHYFMSITHLTHGWRKQNESFESEFLQNCS